MLKEKPRVLYKVLRTTVCDTKTRATIARFIKIQQGISRRVCGGTSKRNSARTRPSEENLWVISGDLTVQFSSIILERIPGGFLQDFFLQKALKDFLKKSHEEPSEEFFEAEIPRCIPAALSAAISRRIPEIIVGAIPTRRSSRILRILIRIDRKTSWRNSRNIKWQSALGHSRINLLRYPMTNSGRNLMRSFWRNTERIF